MNKLMAKRIKRIRRHLDDWKNDIYGVVQAEFEPDDQALSDLLADIMHFCEAKGHDFDRIVEWARGNYESERGPGDDIEQDARRLDETGNGLDRETLTGLGFTTGEIWRNEGGEGLNGWFYSVGSAATQGPFADKTTATMDARKRFGKY